MGMGPPLGRLGLAPPLVSNRPAVVPLHQRAGLMLVEPALVDIIYQGGEYMDAKGQHFLDLKGAKAYAARIARDLGQEGGYVGSVCIADEQGNELDRVPIVADFIGGG
jgi:hypothetical protein